MNILCIRHVVHQKLNLLGIRLALPPPSVMSMMVSDQGSLQANPFVCTHCQSVSTIAYLTSFFFIYIYIYYLQQFKKQFINCR